MNKNTYNLENTYNLSVITLKKSFPQSENKESLRVDTGTHQFVNIKEEVKVTQGWNGTQRSENSVQMMIYSSRLQIWDTWGNLWLQSWAQKIYLKVE